MLERERRTESFFEAWSSSLAAMMSQLGPLTWNAIAAIPLVEKYPAIVTLRAELSGALTGCVWIRIGAADAVHLLAAFLGETPEIDQELDASQQDAIVELCGQWAGLAVTRLAPGFGEVFARVSAEVELPAQSAEVRLLRMEADAEKLSLVLDTDISLGAVPDQHKASAAASLPKEPRRSNREELLSGGNLDLLLDVQLGVTLRFGSRRAPLREVLELSPGMVLELNREIQEPVDLLLNDRVIARGEVVVVDGNYGLSVTEIIAPDPRPSGAHGKGLL